MQRPLTGISDVAGKALGELRETLQTSFMSSAMKKTMQNQLFLR